MSSHHLARRRNKVRARVFRVGIQPDSVAVPGEFDPRSFTCGEKKFATLCSVFPRHDPVTASKITIVTPIALRIR
jgi:hypothetical protein